MQSLTNFFLIICLLPLLFVVVCICVPRVDGAIDWLIFVARAFPSLLSDVFFFFSCKLFLVLLTKTQTLVVLPSDVTLNTSAPHGLVSVLVRICM